MKKVLFSILVSLAMLVAAVPLLTIAGDGLCLSTIPDCAKAESEIGATGISENPNDLKYSSENGGFFYFIDGKYPQSYVGNAMNNTLKNQITAEVAADYTLVIGGAERGVYTYNGTEYMQLVVDKNTTITLDGTNVTFSAGEVYYFEVEPIVWRVSDYGVKATDYPSFYSDIRTADKNVVCVSDLVLDYGAVESDPTHEGWMYTQSDAHKNLTANYTVLRDEFLYAGSASKYIVYKYATLTYQKPTTVCGILSSGIIQASTTTMGDVEGLQASASDLVCVLAGVNSGEGCAYSTRDLENIDVGSYVTKYGATTSLWLQSQAGIRLNYIYKFEKNATYLQAGIDLAKNLKGVSDYSSADTNNIKEIVFDYLDENGQYLINGTNVASATGTVIDVSKAQNGSIKLYIRGTTAYILSKYHIFASQLSYAFNNMQNLEYIYFDNINTSEVTSMAYMFHGCSSLMGQDFPNFDTSKCTNMYRMFCGCKNMEYADISNFDTSKVIHMSYMFYGCEKLAGLDSDIFSTQSATTMLAMFYGCKEMTYLNLPTFNTSKVTDMSFMFYMCENIGNLDLSGFDTSKVTDMNYMFRGCISTTELNLTGWNTSNVEDMKYMFYQCKNLITIKGSLNTSKVTNMKAMFNSCEKLEKIDTYFDLSKVEDLSYMFQNCYQLVTVHARGFGTDSAPSARSMFYNCYNLWEIDVYPEETENGIWTFSDTSYMFYKCSVLHSFSNMKIATINADMSYMFYGCEIMLSVPEIVSTEGATTMKSMFFNCSAMDD